MFTITVIGSRVREAVEHFGQPCSVKKLSHGTRQPLRRIPNGPLYISGAVVDWECPAAAYARAGRVLYFWHGAGWTEHDATAIHWTTAPSYTNFEVEFEPHSWQQASRDKQLMIEERVQLHQLNLSRLRHDLAALAVRKVFCPGKNSKSPTLSRCYRALNTRLEEIDNALKLECPPHPAELIERECSDRWARMYEAFDAFWPEDYRAPWDATHRADALSDHPNL